MRLTSTSNPVVPNEVRGLSRLLVFPPRWGVRALPLLLALLAAPSARAEYIVLRSGERIHVNGYQLVGDKYRLQLQGGWVDVQTADVEKIEPEEVFTPVVPDPPVPLQPIAPPYRELVSAAASRYGVDAELISSVMEVESHFDAKAVSPKNARGLMQLSPQTAARLGVKDIFDPQENIDAGTRYLKELLQLYNNNLTLALAAYNAGPDKVQKYGDVPPYRETVSYVNQVKRKYQKSKSAAAAKTAPSAAPKAPASAPASGTSATPPSAPPSPTPKTLSCSGSGLTLRPDGDRN
ncbi:MAG: lytic transglycosylase domain-containing protein [Acidobacteria bacterium]|nr:MAG: lytic transglycosylase domain-containing protein [Acidobacteriota bacterium]